MQRHWWEAPEWGKEKAMVFSDKSGGRTRRVTDDTDPHLVPQPNGQYRLELRRPHPQRPKARIYY